MQIVITATGERGKSMSQLLTDLSGFLQDYPVLTDTGVRIYEGDGRSFSENVTQFTVAASPSGRKEAGESGDGDTYTIERKDDGNWYVMQRGVGLGAFGRRTDAVSFMKVHALGENERGAFEALVDGKHFQFNGEVLFTGGIVKNAKGGGGEIPATLCQGECFVKADDPRLNRVQSAAEGAAIYRCDIDDISERTAPLMARFERLMADKRNIARAEQQVRANCIGAGIDPAVVRKMALDKAEKERAAARAKTRGIGFQPEERGHASHLAKRLEEYRIANRASMTANEIVKFAQAETFLRRIAEGAGGDFAEMRDEYADQLSEQITDMLQDLDFRDEMSEEYEQQLTDIAKFLRHLACQPERDDELRDAAKALYLAGHWQLDPRKPTDLTPFQQCTLWSDLRDALGLPEGTARATQEGAGVISLDATLEELCTFASEPLGEPYEGLNDLFSGIDLGEISISFAAPEKYGDEESQ